MHHQSTLYAFLFFFIFFYALSILSTNNPTRITEKLKHPLIRRGKSCRFDIEYCRNTKTGARHLYISSSSSYRQCIKKYRSVKPPQPLGGSVGNQASHKTTGVGDRSQASVVTPVITQRNKPKGNHIKK